MALEPPPFAVRTLGPFPKQVTTLWRMRIRPFAGRRGPSNLEKFSLRVQIIPGMALPVSTNHAFLLLTQTVEGYGPILSIRPLLMLSPMDILKNWFIPWKIPRIDGYFPERPEPISLVLSRTIIPPLAPFHRHFLTMPEISGSLGCRNSVWSLQGAK